MKKILTAFLGAFLLCGPAKLFASQMLGDEPLKATNDISTTKLRASTDVAVGVSSGGVFYNTYGLFNQVDVIVSPQSGSTDAVRFGGFTLSTITANTNNQLLFSSITAGGTTYLSVNISSQPTWPRNVIAFSSTTVGASTTIINGLLHVFGVDGLGNWTSETISFSTSFVQTTTGTLSTLSGGTTNTQLRGQGRVAFASISSFTIVITSMSRTFGLQTSTFTVNIGYGNRLGFSNDVRYWADVYKIVEDNNNVSPLQPGPIDTDYNTYTPAILPDGQKSYRLMYRVKNAPTRK